MNLTLGFCYKSGEVYRASARVGATRRQVDRKGRPGGGLLAGVCRTCRVCCCCGRTM